jgi:hypothetical protein
MPAGRKPIYASPAERRAAARAKEQIRDIPRKLEVARRRHRAAVSEAKRAGRDVLLTEDEKGWS